MDDRSHVWLITDDATRRERWRAALAVPECVVLDEVPSDPRSVDVVVADRPLSAAEIALLSPGVTRGECALVAVGWHGAADVRLARDSSDREVRLACGLLGRIVRQRRLIARQNRERELLRHLANSDALTGLLNRRAWDDAWPRRMAEVSETGRVLSLAIVDLDRLKTINHARGHATGDGLLRALARGLTAATTGQDLVARLAGDEFVVACWTPEAALAPEFMQRLHGRVQDELARTAAELVPALEEGETCSASLGWVLVDGAKRRPARDWMNDADRALRQAKREGGGRCVRAEE